MNKENALVLIDNGHGKETKGKCSPDGKFKEYAYTRHLAILLEQELSRRGIRSQRIVSEESDTPLRTRCNRANAICAQYGKSSVLLVSIHVNAAGGDGRWHTAAGWSAWVAPRSSRQSKELAWRMLAAARKHGVMGNRAVPGEGYWTGDFAIVRDTVCPAVLVENLFQDNREDITFMLTPQGAEILTAVMADGIEAFINGSE